MSSGSKPPPANEAHRGRNEGQSHMHRQVEHADMSGHGNRDQQRSHDPYFSLAMEHMQKKILDPEWRNSIFQRSSSSASHPSIHEINIHNRFARSIARLNKLNSREPNPWTVRGTIAPCGHIALSPDRCFSCEMIAELPTPGLSKDWPVEK
ncbi:uncharacterized protein LOC116255386 [Nymphaea colorata]|nr:uncharacterized protein LOC116255386 [Nymphaea colorata]